MAADDWKHRTATGPRPGRPTAKGKGKGVSRLAVAVFPLLVAGGVAVGLLTWVRSEPAPFLLSMPIAEYEQWPGNPWAQKDAEGLVAALRKQENGFIPTQSQSQAGGIVREIEQHEVRAKADRGQPVVVHLNALAVADGDEVLILMSKAGPVRSDLWEPLEKVLQAVSKLGGDRLLILDLRPVPDPRVGQTGNELAKALHRTLDAKDKAKQLPYLVAAHCAPAEYPYVSPELGRGVFAEFLRLGLAGWADGFTGAADKEVHAVELVAFARAWTVHWLRTHKVPVAAPVLYGTGGDFVLRHVQDPPAWPEPKTPDARPEDLVKAWQAVDEWRAAGAVHKYPRTFRQLQELVARTDQAAAGDGNWDSLAIKLREGTKPLADQRALLEPKAYPLLTVGRLERLASPRPGDPAPPLPTKAADPKAAEAKGPDFKTEFRKLQDALKIALKAMGTKEKPVDKKESDEAKAGLEKAILAYVAAPPEPPPYDQTVLGLFKDLLGSDGTERPQANLEQYLRIVRDLPTPPTHLELAYLALVADPSPEERRQWPGELARFLLAAVVAGEEATTVSGRGLLRMTVKPENGTSLEEAEREFTTALKDVFASPPSKMRWNQAADAFRKLATTYRNLGDVGAAHAAAVREWQEDVALLVAVGDFAPTVRSAGNDAFEKQWKKVRDTTGTLRATIDNPQAADVSVTTNEAWRARDALEQMLRQAPTEPDPVEMRARLRLPLWRWEDRQKWTADADAAALPLAKDALGDKAVKPAGDVRTPIADVGFDHAADRRADRAKALLSLVEPNARGEGLAGWRAALADRLVARYKDAASKPALDRAADREKVAWLIHPADLPATPDAANPLADPGAELRIETDRAAANWLFEKRYLAVSREMTQLPGKPAAAVRLGEAISKAVQPLAGWPR